MTMELIIIVLSMLGLFVLYWARWKRTDHSSLLFPHKFLHRVDEVLFDFIKFSFKLYALVVANIKSFFKKVPHKVVHTFHKATHTAAAKSKTWVDQSTGADLDEGSDKGRASQI